MPSNIYTNEIRTWILDHLEDDIHHLILKGSPLEGVSIQWLTDQIRGKKLALKKYPFLKDYPTYIFPTKLSLEQSSSQLTAVHKSSLVTYGEIFIDLTGGMGIDSFFVGRHFDELHYIEPNEELCENARHNFERLGISRAHCHNTTAEEFLSTYNRPKADLLFIDPSRRIDGGRKTSIHNCVPDVVSLLAEMKSVSQKVMMKLSPMQDISECLIALDGISEIHIVSIKNEVKELLLLIDQEKHTDPKIIVTDLSGEEKITHTFSISQKGVPIDYSEYSTFIYQPAPALVKSEMHDVYARKMDLKKLHPNTQLYTADSYHETFFGRIFEVKHALTKKNKNTLLPLGKANIISKNYPLSPSQIAKKWKIKDGGDVYLLAFTQSKKDKVLIVVNRLK